MKTPDEVFDWAESLMDAAEETRGGYQPFVSLEARERERGTAERIVNALTWQVPPDRVLVKRHAYVAYGRWLDDQGQAQERIEENERLRQAWEREASKYGPPAYELPNDVWKGNDEDGILGRLEAALEGRI
jgi:hypothetical protein